MTRTLTVSVAALTTTLTVMSGASVPSAEAAPRPSRTKTSATWSARSAVAGSLVTVTGTVGGSVKGSVKGRVTGGVTGGVTGKVPGERRVVLQQRTASGWRRVDQARSSSDGAYSFVVPTDWLYSSKMRVLSTRSRRARADASSAKRITVEPGYQPAGSPGAWRPIRRSPRYRINPCQTVRYRLNSTQGLPDPETAQQASQAALGAVTMASGVRFEYAGTTGYVPGAKGRWPRRTDLVIAWAKPSETRWRIGEGVSGRGGAVDSRWARDARGRRVAEMYRSGVVLDALEPAIDATNTIQILQHELGHVMGLGHVNDPLQHMNGHGGGYDVPPLQWGAGDLTGFRKVGVMAGCLR
ncbi:hypothetical protein [Nocardioides sp. LHG3406-4]|uniref:hypothetical protein n=1 Tax=Nocardioides sp. LHG3406-4 TaxID=2804575 RepID=UPI003CF0D2B1